MLVYVIFITLRVGYYKKLIECFEEYFMAETGKWLVAKEDFITLRPRSAFQLTLLSVIIFIPLNAPRQVRFGQLFNRSLHRSEINQVVIISLSAKGETYVTCRIVQI
jgi:hypothetical protein